MRPNARYRVPKFNGRYTFGYNQFVDNRPAKNSQNNSITLRIVTPKYTGSGSVIGTDDNSMTILSTAHEVVMRLPNDNAVYYRDMQNALKIEDYIPISGMWQIRKKGSPPSSVPQKCRRLERPKTAPSIP